MTTHEKLEKELERLELRLLTDDVRRDRAAESALLAGPFVEFGGSGRVLDERAIVDNMGADLPAERAVRSPEITRLADAAALVTCVPSRRRGSHAPAAWSLRSSVRTMVHGRWVMVLHQGAPTGEDQAQRAADQQREPAPD